MFMMTNSRIAVVALLMLCAVPSWAQTASPAMQEANTLFQAQKWDEAARAFEAITKADPSNGRAWNQLGRALLAQNKFDGAITAFEKGSEATKGTPVQAFAMYGLASTYARAGDKAKALDWLSRSFDAGLPQPNQIAADPNLASIKAEPRFQELVKAAEKIMKPCMFTDGYRQFDFWVGEWDVFATNGQQVGSSRVNVLQQGCIVEENWEAGGGNGSGQSFNFYNPVTRRWHQSYMGSGGDNWMMDGEYKDNALRYEGVIYSPRGQIMVHMTFFNLGPGKVRQFAETSFDGGKTWVTTWDGLYVKRKALAGER